MKQDNFINKHLSNLDTSSVLIIILILVFLNQMFEVNYIIYLIIIIYVVNTYDSWWIDKLKNFVTYYFKTLLSYLCGKIINKDAIIKEDFKEKENINEDPNKFNKVVDMSQNLNDTNRNFFSTGDGNRGLDSYKTSNRNFEAISEGQAFDDRMFY